MEAAAKSNTNFACGGLIAAVAFAVLRALSIHQPTHAPPTTVAIGQAEPHLTYTYGRFTPDSGRAVIHASGQIGWHEEDAFNAWLASLPAEQRAQIRIGATVMIVDSPGGNIDGAIHLAGWVKDNQIDTVVNNGATCASACSVIWGAGYHKWAGVDAHIGVHSGSAATASDDQRAGMEAMGTVWMARTLASEKAPAAVVAAVTTTDKADMHWLNAEEATAWGAALFDKDGKTI